MLNNKTAVVTGGGRGIGRAISLELARKGAAVAVVYGSGADAAAETVASIEADGGRAMAYRCDVSDFDAVRELADLVISGFGGIDILVNNAGITKDGLLVSMSRESFDRVIDVNLGGAFNMIRHTYAHFMKKRSGRIINISSVAGIMGNPGQANYASSKAGLIGLTKTVAKELASRGVTCNAIAPGFIASDMSAKLPEKALAAAKEAIPMKRIGDARDVARLAAFLASDAAAYITGEVIRVDGGMCI